MTSRFLQGSLLQKFVIFIDRQTQLYIIAQGDLLEPCGLAMSKEIGAWRLAVLPSYTTAPMDGRLWGNQGRLERKRGNQLKSFASGVSSFRTDSGKEEDTRKS